MSLQEVLCAHCKVRISNIPEKLSLYNVNLCKQCKEIYNTNVNIICNENYIKDLHTQIEILQKENGYLQQQLYTLGRMNINLKRQNYVND